MGMGFKKTAALNQTADIGFNLQQFTSHPTTLWW
jgi:hypothetical protein